jgi:hypothetical protein
VEPLPLLELELEEVVEDQQLELVAALNLILSLELEEGFPYQLLVVSRLKLVLPQLLLLVLQVLPLAHPIHHLILLQVTSHH